MVLRHVDVRLCGDDYCCHGAVHRRECTAYCVVEGVVYACTGDIVLLRRIHGVDYAVEYDGVEGAVSHKFHCKRRAGES